MTSDIVHFEFAGPGEHELHAFYEGLFGWPLQSMGPGYALIETPVGSPDGAVREAEAAEMTIGVEVGDLDGAVAKAVDLGGAVTMPPTDNGWVNKAQVTDPAGNLVTLIQADGDKEQR